MHVSFDTRNSHARVLQVEMPQSAPPERGRVDGQHILISQLIVHKVQPQMSIHSLHKVLIQHPLTLVTKTLVTLTLVTTWNLEQGVQTHSSSSHISNNSLDGAFQAEWCCIRPVLTRH